MCQAKARGNKRYRNIIDKLSMIANIWIDPKTLLASGGAAPDFTPTSFSFDFVSVPLISWTTADEVNVGNTLTGTACITRCIARGLTEDIIAEMAILDPTSAATIGNTTAVPRFGPRTMSLEVGPYGPTIPAAEAVIAVNLLP
jgi:hypothetical protein